MAQVSRETTERFFKAVKRNSGVECSQYPNMFIPDDLIADGVSGDYKFLRKVCERCPVQQLCADYAIELNPTHGMWAGMTPKQIAKKHKERFGNVTTRRDSEFDSEVIDSRDGTRQAEEGWGESDIRPLHLSPSDSPDWSPGVEDEVLAGWEDWDSDSFAA